MPEDPLAQPRQPAAPATGTGPSATPAASVAATPGRVESRPAPGRDERSAANRADREDDGDEARPLRAKNSPWLIVLGVLTVVLLIAVVVFANRASARDRTIQESKNRMDQLQAASTQLQTQVDDAKKDAASVQKKLDAAEAESTQLKSDLEKSKAAIVEVQARLEKARATATAYQTQAEENKVASLKHQGEVEVAHSQTAVMLEQLNKAKADLADLKTQLAESQDKLDKAEAEIARLQKPPAKPAKK